MLKLILGICVTILSTLAGKRFTDKYFKRYNFFLSLGGFNSAAIRNMDFEKKGISEMLEMRFDDDDFNDYLQTVSKSVKSETDCPLPPEFLEEKDRKAVREYFQNIGKFSSSTEKDFLLVKRGEFSDRTSELKSNSDKFSSLGLKLGFALGITVFILLI